RWIASKSDGLAVAVILVGLGGFVDAGRWALLSSSVSPHRPVRKGGLMNFAPASQQIKAATTQLSVAGVGKRFGGVTAVENVSIDIPKGRILSIIGPNGAGKTSLLNMISGFYKPDMGRITLEGRDITRSAPSEVAALGVAR